MARFEVVFGDDALTHHDPDELFSDFEDKCYLIDYKKSETGVGVIVFADGSYESPEDNSLDRHYSGLVDLLNQVAEKS